MLQKLGRVLSILLSILFVLASALAAFGASRVRSSFPKTQGEMRVAGLDGAVEVLRDGYGVPHIYAGTQHDLFFAQGYVHAQDRFWQMDFWRHIGSGRLSELFGESQVETDTFLRTLGWARVAEQEMEILDPESRTILEAYAEGVNAYLADHQGAQLSLEYAVLKLQNAGYVPEPWQPLHTLTWGKVMAYNLGGNLSSERVRAELLKTLTVEQVEALYPSYPADSPVIVPGFEAAATGGAPEALPAGVAEGLAPAWEALSRQSEALAALLGPTGRGIGSNSWAVSGARTASGLPLLANDTHLAAQMPSIWYEVGLHCADKGPGCPYNVTGVSFAGVPGVIIGHNDRIAWAFTNMGPDVQDLYIEKVNPANPDQVEYLGEWVDVTKVAETIRVAGGEPVELTVRLTRHGPLLWQDSLDKFREKAGIELPEAFGLALRWTALQPCRTFQAIWQMNRAENWEQFREAASHFDVPSQNLVYADVDGHIGYQSPGLIPIRAAGHTGRLPVAGWTGENEWQGFIPFDELPTAFDPPQGYIVAANNAVVGPDYPYTLSNDWDLGFRAARIAEMIEGAAGPLDAAAMQAMHGDDSNPVAGTLVPLLLELPVDDPRLAGARDLLRGWDGQQGIDSAAAAVFEATWRHLLAGAFGDELPEDRQPWGGDTWIELVRRVAPDPSSPWWDDVDTPEAETREAILLRALGAAVDELEERLGKDPAKWAWGNLHTITFRNETFGTSGIGAIEALFNRGPYATAGGSDIVNATSWNPAEGYEVSWVPSKRMIVDLSDLDRSLMMHTTGQSGHAFHPHYVDMVNAWRTIEYHPMLWGRAQVEGAAEKRLTLKP